MNLKDRLENIRKTNVISIKEDNEKDFLFDIEDVFADSKELRTIITETIASGKNIVFVSEPSIDKSLVAKYFSYLLLNRLEDVIVSENLTNEILFSDSRINILPKPSIKEIVKILECIMYGYKSFVFGMNFATLDNVLNKIKTAISINCNGVSSEAIETLLSSSNLVIVYLNKNVDGLFYISKIDKIVSENFVSDIVTVIDFQQQKPISKKNKKNKKVIEEEKKESTSIVETTEQVNVEVVENNQLDVVEVDESISKQTTQVDEIVEIEKDNEELVNQETVEETSVEQVQEQKNEDVLDAVVQRSELVEETSVEQVQEQKNEDVLNAVVQKSELVEETSVEQVQEQKNEDVLNAVVQKSELVEETSVEQVQEQKNEETINEVIVENVEEQKESVVVDADKIQQEQKEIIAEISKKVNKYKLLKDKVKNKKVDITE